MADEGKIKKYVAKNAETKNKNNDNNTMSDYPVSHLSIHSTDPSHHISVNYISGEYAQSNQAIVRAMPCRRMPDQNVGGGEGEALLQEANEQVSNILENMSDGFFFLDSKLIVRYFNKAAGQLLDRKNEDMVGYSLFDEVFPESKGSIFEKRFIKTLKDKRAISFEAYFKPCENWYEVRVHPYGEGISVFFQITTERREAEECLRRYRFHLEKLVRERTAKLTRANKQLEREIAERKRTEEVLRESEQNFRRTFDQSPIGAAIISVDYRFLRVNAELCRIIGYSEEELLTLSLSDITHADDLKAEEENTRALLAGKIDQFQMDKRYIRKDGGIVWIRLSVRLVKDASGRTIYFLPMMEDITERKRMEEELQRAQKLESLSILAGGIAHDFNNLLTAIIGNLSLAERQARSGSNVSELLKEIKYASHQAKRLTHQLLTFAKGGAPIRKATSLSRLLKHTISFILSGSRVRYELFIQDNLWLAEIDEGQISQVINNLMINASQAMPEGGIIEVQAENVAIVAKDTLSSKEGEHKVEDEHKVSEGKYKVTEDNYREGNYIKISFKDHGVGIPEEYLSKIFDPYFTTKQKGSGLGLAVTYSIIKKHGGHIEVESKVGIGTAFSIYLPASKKEILAISNDTEKSGLFSSQRLYSGQRKILFMDDQQNIRDMVGRMLTHLKYEVELAKDGAEAIELYKKAKESKHPFDAVMLDLTVPGGMGGKDAIQKLLEIDPNVKAIVSSGYFNDPIMSEYRLYGFHGVVAKPYEVEELTEILNQVLR